MEVFMGQKLSISDLDLNGKKVLIRVDYNVPLDNGEITDDTRIRASLPTIQYALTHGAAVILMSHLGRPQGKPDKVFSLEPCARRLSEMLQNPVKMAPECVGLEVDQLVKNLKSGEVLLLENLRFHKGEEHPEQEPGFVNLLANLGDVYVNDAFGTAHRDHTSTALIATFFPGKAAAGFLMEKEIAYLGATMQNPRRPFYAILGGAKISTKFKVIKALMRKADVLLIGGAMAYTFFKAEKVPIGNSLFEESFITVAREILDITGEPHCDIILPLDCVITQKMDSGETRIADMKEGIPDGWMGVDIGPKTLKLYEQELSKASSIFWNGPLGVFEHPPFNAGTDAIAKALAGYKSATTVIGGGDSIAAIEAAGVADKIDHLSTGGGAALEYIEYGSLPGINALSDKVSNNIS
jgi:3-phosphoglycerate kinase